MKIKRSYILFAIACVIFMGALPFLAETRVTNNSISVSKPEMPSTESPISVQDRATISNATNFEKCKAIVINSVDAVSDHYKTAKILDNNLMYMVRMCTNDGSVLATCSAPDGNVSPITKVSPDCPL
ncbi:hypothetical protein [Acinetobacter rathckeae]|uniref:hypothetical protein n=1 Tax=Acinetobacter rathckeae TaxID=2605272 RepID=UPI0018A26AB2|nr:hypothetical protein [Acinetobacter rathckeae]MBF7696619.1 hypothetical protein [Acinetobacter rathckeae]